MSKKTELQDSRRRIHAAQGEVYVHMELLGDQLAKRHKWNNLRGIDALQFHLVKKHNWLPSAVKSMSMEDLRFALTEELESWTVPAE